jgi:radical SAM/Cys-rich protein
MTVPESTPLATVDDGLVSGRGGGPADFDARLGEIGHRPLRRGRLTTLQVNIGLRCNLACHHCHVESGPLRSEALSRAGVERVAELLEQFPGIETLDLTGGAPELHPDFRWLVMRARALGRRVIDRCNLTVFFEPGQSDTPGFLAEHSVDIVASLPCHGPANVEAQRGRGVFERSIEALQTLNALGYGQKGPKRRSAGRLDLVYNPVGAHLPPPQAGLEAEYRVALREQFEIEFDDLLTITNMPIKRFAHALARDGDLDAYMQLLFDHFNPRTIDRLMCRSLLSVDHEGRLFDCDFNQALGLPTPEGPMTIFEPFDARDFDGRPIATASHCFGCTAGAGSSCGGALS